jgi:uncharacterized membrane protein
MRGFQSLEWIGWNLMLAVIPVVIGYALAFCIDSLTVRKRKVPWAIWILPALAWLAFLPNTCYLLSEWRHFLFDERFTSIRDDAGDDPYRVLQVARQGLFFLAYSAVGALCFALAIRPMHHVLRKAKFRLILWGPPFFLLVSMGVYMGLIVRLNSWDIVRRPLYVLEITKHAVTTPLLLQTIAIFAGLLWLLYTIIDIWIDGLKMRFQGAKRTPQ